MKMKLFRDPPVGGRGELSRLFVGGLVVLLVSVAAAVINVTAAGRADALSCSGQGPSSITRDHVMARGEVWVVRKVPYNAKCRTIRAIAMGTMSSPAKRSERTAPGMYRWPGAYR